LLDAVIDLTLERHRDLLKRGAVLVDDRDDGIEPRVLFYLEHAIQDAGLTRSGERRVISRRMMYVELDAAGVARHLRYTPYLDYRPLATDDPAPDRILDHPACAWIRRDMEQKAQGHAIAKVIPERLAEVRDARLALIARTKVAVKDRLTKEIAYWDHRAEQLKLQEQAGRSGARLNSGEARRPADNLQARLHKRLAELQLESADFALASRGAGQRSGDPEGTHRRRGRPATSRRPDGHRHPGVRSPGPRHRHGSRTASRLRPHRS
jgi:hypothetical protein